MITPLRSISPQLGSLGVTVPVLGVGGRVQSSAESKRVDRVELLEVGVLCSSYQVGSHSELKGRTGSADPGGKGVLYIL